jgi:hypothetical protein
MQVLPFESSPMKRCVVVLLSLLLFTSNARAEEPGGMLAAGSAMIVLPQADADDMADTSLGVRGSFVYWAHRNVGVVGSFEYVFVNEEEIPFYDEVDLTFYSINVGARFTTTKRTKLQPFGEVLVGRHTSVFDSSIGDDTDSDLGFRLGAGAVYRFQDGLALVGQVSYTSAEIDEADIAGMMLEVGVAWDQ